MRKCRFRISCNHRTKIAAERIGVCSWSFRKPLRDVATEMDKMGVKGIHLALGPFIHADGRHGDAESAETLAFVKEKIAKGEWMLMSTMVGTIGEDYSTLESLGYNGNYVIEREGGNSRSGDIKMAMERLKN